MDIFSNVLESTQFEFIYQNNLTLPFCTEFTPVVVEMLSKIQSSPPPATGIFQIVIEKKLQKIPFMRLFCC